MNFYIAHIPNRQVDQINLYSYLDNKEKKSVFNSFDELGFINQSDKILVLIPSSEVSSYKFIKNNSLSNQVNIANFLSEIDHFFVGNVSDYEYILDDDVGHVIDKDFLLKLNTSLSYLSAEIQIAPEYSINHKSGEDIITQIDSRFIFSYSNKTGFAVEASSLNQYLDIVINNNPAFNPIINSLDKEVGRKFDMEVNEDYNFFNNELNTSKLPNFFKIQLSLKLLLNRFNFSNIQLVFLTLSLVIILMIPNVLININNTNTDIFSNATYDIFKSIDNNINRVVNPKSQIDQILVQFPESNRVSYDGPKLELFFKYGSKYISDIFIDFENSQTTLEIKSMPEIQFNILMEASKKFITEISTNDLDISNGIVNGKIIIGIIND
tara:strand:- start:1310 stop:2452 length:1143 start_codon:yes stop_codon:yes gene_type:complete